MQRRGNRTLKLLYKYQQDFVLSLLTYLITILILNCWSWCLQRHCESPVHRCRWLAINFQDFSANDDGFQVPFEFAWHRCLLRAQVYWLAWHCILGREKVKCVSNLRAQMLLPRRMENSRPKRNHYVQRNLFVGNSHRWRICFSCINPFCYLHALVFGHQKSPRSAKSLKMPPNYSVCVQTRPPFSPPLKKAQCQVQWFQFATTRKLWRKKW